LLNQSRLYPFPRGIAFSFRYAFHVIEPRNRIAHVSSDLQRLLALLEEGES
jgi:hypothetical protein